MEKRNKHLWCFSQVFIGSSATLVIWQATPLTENHIILVHAFTFSLSLTEVPVTPIVLYQHLIYFQPHDFYFHSRRLLRHQSRLRDFFSFYKTCDGAYTLNLIRFFYPDWVRVTCRFRLFRKISDVTTKKTSIHKKNRKPTQNFLIFFCQ
jgi:hypothetical protein